MKRSSILKSLNITSLIFTLSILSSCGGEEHHHYHHQKSSNESDEPDEVDQPYVSRAAGKYNKRVKPSESMQIGVRVNHKFDISKLDRKKYDHRKDEYSIGQETHDHGLPLELTPENYNPKQVKIIKRRIQNNNSLTSEIHQTYEETGTASWYGPALDGKLTASGEIHNIENMTASHPTLPLPSIAKVTNLANGRSVVVRVNDRGPLVKNRLIDVSQKAATELGFSDRSTTTVRVELLQEDTNRLLENRQVTN